MKIVKTVLCILFGLMFINAGLNKLFNYMPMPKMTAEQMKLMEAFVKISWLMPLTGIVEIVGGLLFMLPKYRALGAIVILPVMVGIIVHNAIFEPSGLSIALPFFLINLWIIGDNRNKYKPMINSSNT
ncbi:putative membrane protein YphA (DoxX/SURF4 family) [Pedobacter cryoconitis]|uniref:Putative membrane protein YphA (DoxX/SURF4 family) n=1 Tax=Pedobacter cryoconitis TaxID=188932 RepID=A0A7W9E1F1_9SPHI|nr:DoxX family protein [Pedobacter cryoconitis]MBB5638274.1 putative membrane protein YphA (DoxX/SURF4 family) [Pedobacter cryoconitis]